MKPAAFTYMRPDSVDEACQVLARHGEEARLLAGGQSLGAMLNMRLVTPAVLVDLNRLDALASITEEADCIVTGALVRQDDALADAAIRRHVPLLAEALPHVGHYQTRSRGTLGGSVAHADPSAEIPLVLATLGGEIALRSAKRRRRVAAADFFQAALVTTRAPDEIVEALRWPKAGAGARHAFAEFALRGGDYAIVAAAAVLETGADGRVTRLRLGFGGCGDTPQVVEPEEARGQALDAARIAEIAQAAVAPITCRSDLVATDDYRRHLAFILGSAVLLSAAGLARQGS